MQPRPIVRKAIPMKDPIFTSATETGAVVNAHGNEVVNGTAVDPPRVVVFEPRDLGPKTWGREILVTLTKHHSGKLLLMRAGEIGPCQYHVDKDEAFYVYSGKALVWHDPGDGVLHDLELTAGMAVHIPPRAVHQVEAIEDCVFFETSTPHFEDRVNVEARYK